MRTCGSKEMRRLYSHSSRVGAQKNDEEDAIVTPTPPPFRLPNAFNQALFLAVAREDFECVNSILNRFLSLASEARDLAQRTPVHKAVVL